MNPRETPTVSSLWIGEELSPLEQACIQSFLQRGFGFQLHCYTPVRNVPAGTTILDATRILPEDRIIRYRHGPGAGSLALFADMLRYKLLYEQGGWWVDMDVFCLAASLPNEGSAFGYEEPGAINAAVIRMPAGHPAMLAAYEACVALGDDVEYGATGAQLLTRVVREHGLQGAVFPRPVFYPIHYSQFWFVLDPRRTAQSAEMIRSAATCHFWNNMFNRAKIDKYVMPPYGSLLWNMYEWTIGTRSFERQYVLSPGCPADKIDLRIVDRSAVQAQ